MDFKQRTTGRPPQPIWMMLGNFQEPVITPTPPPPLHPFGKVYCKFSVKCVDFCIFLWFYFLVKCSPIVVRDMKHNFLAENDF